MRGEPIVKCPKKRCTGMVVKHVRVIVECDEDCFNLSKKGIRKKDVKILGVDWNGMSFCPKCGRIVYNPHKTGSTAPAE